jgi:hypothetical protein
MIHVYLGHTRDEDGVLRQHVTDVLDAMPCTILGGSFSEGSVEPGFEQTIMNTIKECEKEGWRVSFDVGSFSYES